MNMRIERNVIQPQLDEMVDKTGKAGKAAKVAKDASVIVDHKTGHEHHAGLGSLDMSQQLPPPKPNALDALQVTTTTTNTTTTPGTPTTPSTTNITTTMTTESTPTTPGSTETTTTTTVGESPQTDNQNNDFATKVGPPAANAVAQAMLLIGLAQIQTSQSMATSQNDARQADLTNYLAKVKDQEDAIDDEASAEKNQALVEGIVGGIGAGLSVAGAVFGPFAAADGSSTLTQLLGGTETSGGLLSTSGGLLSSEGDAISKGTAGVAETNAEKRQTKAQGEAGIAQSAESAAQEYMTKYWDMQQKSLDSVSQVIQGQGQAKAAAAQNI